MTEAESKIVQAVTSKLLGPTYACDNCTFTTTDISVMRYIKHYNERVDPDGPVPYGECPKCGALCYER